MDDAALQPAFREDGLDSLHHPTQAVRAEQIYIQNSPAFEVIQHIQPEFAVFVLSDPDYDADTICQRVTSRVRQGSIVLFHNAALHTPEALPAILTCLINDGYTVVPISQLILPQPYTIDHTGRQFPAETGA